jgi:S1-C subfamily serine protease
MYAMNQTASACGAVLGRVAAGLAAALATTIALGANAQLTQLPDFTDLVERTAPAVVNIRTTTHVGGNAGPQSPELDENDPFNEFFRRFFPQPGGPNGPNGPSARAIQRPAQARFRCRAPPVRSARCRAASGRVSCSRPTATS